MLRKLFRIGVLIIAVSACSKESEQAKKVDHNPDWERGRAVFVANCVACHNSDPSKDGPLGPAIKGSAQELIEARVLRSGYPPDYKPKRNTKLMPSFPYLKDEVPYIAAFLR